MRIIVVKRIRFLLPWLLALSTTLAAADDNRKEPRGPFVENDQIRMRLIPHTPEQMAAFYEARGFPRRAIARLGQTCFITVHIKNKGTDIVWLELANWRFDTTGGALARLDKTYWKQQWEEIDLPLANRSTFGWTQLPEVRDLQPDEPVGGNIVLPRSGEPVTVTADFLTGKTKRKGMLRLRFEEIRCPEDAPAP